MRYSQDDDDYAIYWDMFYSISIKEFDLNDRRLTYLFYFPEVLTPHASV